MTRSAWLVRVTFIQLISTLIDMYSTYLIPRVNLKKP